MAAVLEFAPLIAFGLAYYFGNLYLATAVLMGGMTLCMGISWLLKRPISSINTISLGLVLVFGTATLIMREPRFIQWKGTAFLWLFATVFLASAFIGTRPMAQRMLQTLIPDRSIQRADWQRVNALWVVFCIALGMINLWLAYRASESVWVSFKLFGIPGATFLFLVAQIAWLHQRGRPVEAT